MARYDPKWRRRFLTRPEGPTVPAYQDRPGVPYIVSSVLDRVPPPVYQKPGPLPEPRFERPGLVPPPVYEKRRR